MLTMAEQCIDRQSRSELFRGRQIELVTGRVLLHALDDRGQPLCGIADEPLTPTGRPWDAGYLPHLPRCQGCLAQAAEAPAPGQGTAQASTAQASEVDIRGGLSHPLSITPSLLVQRPALALTTFLHEQLHWLEGPGTDSAIAEASELWPDPPPLAAGGATGPTSTWLHMGVCALEQQSLTALLGPAAAAEELRQHTGYSWIYGQILADPGWFAGFLDRHGLYVPEQPRSPGAVSARPGRAY